MKLQEDLTLPGLLHDLNNVFQTLLGAADSLSDDPRWEKLAAAILRSVERGKNIAAGIQAGVGQSGVGVTAPLETILASAIEFVEDSRVAGRGPEVRFDCEIEPGIELRDDWAWERVLINLFLNATRAMPAGGTISVRAQRNGGNVEIVITDEGSGIAADVLDRLFHPHVSAHDSSGLGLHIVETIVHQEGGEVNAANRADGRGAKFTITLPDGMAAAAKTP